MLNGITHITLVGRKLKTQFPLQLLLLFLLHVKIALQDHMQIKAQVYYAQEKKKTSHYNTIYHELETQNKAWDLYNLWKQYNYYLKLLWKKKISWFCKIIRINFFIHIFFSQLICLFTSFAFLIFIYYVSFHIFYHVSIFCYFQRTVIIYSHYNLILNHYFMILNL